MKQLRYIEVSRRNPVTKIRVGYGSRCGPGLACEDVCVEIRRAGADKCVSKCNYHDNPCGCTVPKPICDPFVARVCALEIDDEGFAIFEWPEKLFNLTEGWYEGHVMTDCYTCGVLPLRVGPRCNVLEVETMPIGPDSACNVGCEDECRDTVCHPKYSADESGAENYIPNYGA